jgi:hypothetical protein
VLVLSGLPARFRVVVTPITQGWSCPRSDFGRRSRQTFREVSNPITFPIAKYLPAYFDMRCQPKLSPTRHFQLIFKAGRRQDGLSIFGADRLHTFRTRQCVKLHAALLLFSHNIAYLHRLFCIGDVCLGIHAQGTQSSILSPYGSALRMFEIRHLRAQKRRSIRVIERLINAIGFLQIAIDEFDERHMPKSYSRGWRDNDSET